LLILLIAISCSGCAMVDMYNWQYTKQEPGYWRERALFYESHYPNANQPEKASMLAEEMRREGQRPRVESREVKRITTYVFDDLGNQLWPIK